MTPITSSKGYRSWTCMRSKPRLGAPSQTGTKQQLALVSRTTLATYKYMEYKIVILGYFGVSLSLSLSLQKALEIIAVQRTLGCPDTLMP